MWGRLEGVDPAILWRRRQNASVPNYRVQFTFVQKVLEAFGFPDEFRDIIKMMYANLTSILKVNGHKGEPFAVKNSCRQGCCASPDLYVIVHEVFLRMIREDAQLKGIKIPGPCGGMGRRVQREMRERGFADDTGVALAGFDQLPRLFQICREYEEISGSKLNEAKSVCLIMGTAKDEARPEGITMEWVRYGIDEMPSKYLGMRFALSAGVGAQWKALRDKVEAEMGEAMGRFAPRSIFGRAMWVKGVFAAKLWYAYRFQVPVAEERAGALAGFQESVEQAMFGGKKTRGRVWPVTRDLARQEYGDGGLKLLDVEAHLKGEWVKMVRKLMEEPGVERPWKNFWFNALDEVYSTTGRGGGTCRLGLGPRLVTSACTFERVRHAATHLMSEVQRAAMLAWGELRIQPAERLHAEAASEQTSRRADRTGATRARRAPPPPAAATCSWEEAADAPIFFDLRAEERGEEPRRARESEATWRRRQGEGRRAREDEALEWAEAGLRRIADLLDDSGRGLITPAEFGSRHPDLSADTYREVTEGRSAEQRAAIAGGPTGWAVGDWVWARDGIGRVRTVASLRQHTWPTSIEPYRIEKGYLTEVGGAVDVARGECERVGVWTRPGAGDAPTRYVFANRDAATAPLDTRGIAVRWASGLERREPVQVEKLGVRAVKQVLAARCWKMPRTFDPTGQEVGVHVASTRAMSAALKITYEKAVALCFERAKNSVLPRYLREIRYKVLISGFMIGRNKAQAGDKRFCARCKALGSLMACATRGARGRGRAAGQAAAHLEETVTHVFSECPRAHDLWKRVLAAWERATGERLDPKDARVTLLGDRSGGQLTSGSGPEEPWVLTHATVLQILWEERNREWAGGPVATAKSLHAKVRARVLLLADGRLAQVHDLTDAEDTSALGGGKHSLDAFDAAWVRTGLVRRTDSSSCGRGLRLGSL